MGNNKLQTFKNEEFGELKVINKNGEPLFLANQLANILGYSKTNRMIERLDLEEKIKISSKEVGTILGCTLNELGLSKFSPKAVLVTESGMYNAILGSEKPQAKKFKRWVTGEVLPSIRKYGIYATEKTIDKIISDPDFGIKLLTQLKEEKTARKIAEEKVTQFLDTTNTLSWNTVAKNLEIGRNTMLKELREMGILQTDVYSYNGEKHVGENHNIPYQRYMKYFVVKYVVKGDKRYPKTLVTAEGQEFLRKKLKR